MRELLRWIVLCIFRVLIHVFFNDVEVVGRHNLPQKGNAVIFVGNHRNQFVDAMIMFCHTRRTPSFIIAAVSLKRRLIAIFAHALRCIPIARPRDLAGPGSGTIRSENLDEPVVIGQEGAVNTNAKVDMKGKQQVGTSGSESPRQEVGKCRIFGQGTKFRSEVAVGDELMTHEHPEFRGRVVAVESDESLLLAEPVNPQFQAGQRYKIYKKVDQGDVYIKVWEQLAKGDSIGIFPEGSSHDRADLLPLKAGVTIMALGAAAKHNVQVNIVPCGLTYFSGHRFRGRAIVEFGKPITIGPVPQSRGLTQSEDGEELVRKYAAQGPNAAKQKRAACGELLRKVERSLRSVTLNVPSYEDREIALLMRALYQPDTLQLSSNKYQALNRAFAELLFGERTHADPEVRGLHDQVVVYRSLLRRYGIRDYQVASGMEEVSTIAFLWMIAKRFLILTVLIGLGLPGSLLNIPVGLLARVIAQRRARQIAPNDPHQMYGALDVVASYKIMVAGIGLPVLHLFYFLLALWWTGSLGQALLVLLILPFLSYASLLLMERGLAEARLLHALCHVAHSRQELNSLQKFRRQLQTQVRQVAERLRAQMGDEFLRLGLDRYNGDRWGKDGQETSEGGEEGKHVSRLWRRSSYKKLERDPFASLPEDVQNDLALDQFI